MKYTYLKEGENLPMIAAFNVQEIIPLIGELGIINLN